MGAYLVELAEACTNLTMTRCENVLGPDVDRLYQVKEIKEKNNKHTGPPKIRARFREITNVYRFIPNFFELARFMSKTQKSGYGMLKFTK